MAMLVVTRWYSSYQQTATKTTKLSKNRRGFAQDLTQVDAMTFTWINMDQHISTVPTCSKHQNQVLVGMLNAGTSMVDTWYQYPAVFHGAVHHDFPQ